MKLGQILMHQTLLTGFWLNTGEWELVPGLFIILIKWQYNEISKFLVVDLHHF